jgi:hypothetical protein
MTLREHGALLWRHLGFSRVQKGNVVDRRRARLPQKQRFSEEKWIIASPCDAVSSTESFLSYTGPLQHRLLTLLNMACSIFLLVLARRAKLPPQASSIRESCHRGKLASSLLLL